jgi:DUF971 family protein
MSQPFEYIEPEEIRRDNEHSQMFVRWNDGHQGRHNYEILRWNCPCAACRGEMGMPGRLDFIKQLAPEETQLAGLEAVGMYAIKPIWGNGHETGLYTYEYLRDLCECEICMRERPTKFENKRLVKSRR